MRLFGIADGKEQGSFSWFVTTVKNVYDRKE